MLLHYSEWVKIQSSCLQNYSYQKHKVCFSSGMQETTYPNIYRWNSSIMVEFKRFYLSNKLRGNLECIYYFYELKWIKEKKNILYIYSSTCSYVNIIRLLDDPLSILCGFPLKCNYKKLGCNMQHCQLNDKAINLDRKNEDQNNNNEYTKKQVLI